MISVRKTTGKDETEFLKQLDQRSGEVNKAVTESVAQIIAAVKEKGDTAVLEYTLKFDGRAPESF